MLHNLWDTCSDWEIQILTNQPEKWPRFWAKTVSCILHFENFWAQMIQDNNKKLSTFSAPYGQHFQSCHDQINHLRDICIKYLLEPLAFSIQAGSYTVIIQKFKFPVLSIFVFWSCGTLLWKVALTKSLIPEVDFGGIENSKRMYCKLNTSTFGWD